MEISRQYVYTQFTRGVWLRGTEVFVSREIDLNASIIDGWVLASSVVWSGEEGPHLMDTWVNPNHGYRRS